MKRILLLLTIVIVYSAANAQDIHFSQFYASPLVLNPANTGKIASKYRACGIYRDQWASISVPFRTFGASFDLPFLYKQLKKNFLGAGLLVVADKSGTGELSNQKIMLSLAYHQKFGHPRNPKHYLSVGFQGGVVQKSVNINKLVFASSYDPNTKTFSLLSQEKFNSSGTISYADVNMGALWSSYFSEMFSVYGGFSYNHLTKPKEQFLALPAANDNFLNTMTVVHAGAKIGINDRVFVSPSMIYMVQTKATEFSIGTSVGFQLNDDKKNPTAFYAGIFYRLADATVALVGFEVQNNRFGLSYDINVSGLKPASNLKGGFELSLVHEGNPSTSPRKVIYCPRF